jgi:hypothetical protein
MHGSLKLMSRQQLNYLTKYLELLDTCFLFLKKKPLSMSCPPISSQNGQVACRKYAS